MDLRSGRSKRAGRRAADGAFWSGRRVLVTGATGFIGSWLVEELLARGAEVAALVRDWNPLSRLLAEGIVRRVEVFQGALEDAAAVGRAVNASEADTVFHLGAQTLVGPAARDPVATFEANIRGTYHVLESCRAHAGVVKRLVVASSDKAYGTARALPYTEAMPPLGRFPYDVSKSCADLLAQAYRATYGLPIAVARCGNVYGGGDLNWSRIVPGTIRSLVRGERPVIRSDGTFKRDYVYVADAVSAYLALAERLDRPGVAGEAFNFGPDRPHAVLDVVNRLRTITRRRSLAPVIRNDARAEIRDQYLDSTKAARRLGWRPAYGLDAGLRRTVAWYVRFLRGGHGRRR